MKNLTNIDDIWAWLSINDRTFSKTKYMINEINNQIVVKAISSVNMENKNLTHIPFKFSKIIGHFNCCDNNLTSFKNFPDDIRGDCFLNNNKITNLKNMPKKIEGVLDLTSNPIENLNDWLLDSNVQLIKLDKNLNTMKFKDFCFDIHEKNNVLYLFGEILNIVITKINLYENLDKQLSDKKGVNKIKV